MNFCMRLAVVYWFAAHVSGAAIASGLLRIEIHPSRVFLRGVPSGQQFVVIGVYADESRRDLTRNSRLTTTRRSVALPESNSMVRAVGKGYSRVIATLGIHRATAELMVSDYARSSGISFERDVTPILTLAGCNNQTCHGSMHGKNGFRLSLFGYDQKADHLAITRGAGGRRVNLHDPAQSLVLLKPSGQVAHGGGQRFAVGSYEYETIAAWLAMGAAGPQQDRSPARSLQVFPNDAILASPEQEQQLVVLLRYPDGTSEDVTGQVRYSSQDETVATVRPGGLVAGRGEGDTFVLVRTSGAVSAVPISVRRSTSAGKRPALPERNLVDTLVFQKLRKLNVSPSVLCSDETFLRRAHLDTLGVLPNSEEMRRFVQNTDPDKRSKSIDHLLSRPEYADYWGMFWGDQFTITARRTGPTGTLEVDDWIRRELRRNTPYNVWVKQIIAGSGPVRENPGLGLVVSRPPLELGSFFSQLFLGVRIQCAECHNHPFERWTQPDFYSFAAFFSSVKSKATKAGPVVYDSDSGTVKNPITGKPAQPRFLGGEPVQRTGHDLRVALADWMTSTRNPYFAKTAVNRIWRQFMGVGLVEPADDLRETNPSTNPELLAALERDFISSGFDLKHLMRTILNSTTYQLSSETNQSNRGDRRNHSHYLVRRLPAEVLLDAIEQVTGCHEPLRFGYTGMKAVERHDVIGSPALFRTFHQSMRDRTCQREANPTLLQTLELLNGEILNDRVSRMQIANRKHPKQTIEELFETALSRAPSPKEMDFALTTVAAEKDLRRGLQDVVWALLNSNEFSYNH